MNFSLIDQRKKFSLVFLFFCFFTPLFDRISIKNTEFIFVVQKNILNLKSGLSKKYYIKFFIFHINEKIVELFFLVKC
jgi:hypothetical protein